MFDNLQKISLLSVESLYFSKDLLLFMKHLEKMTLVLTPSPPIKMSFLFTHSKFDFFLRPPPPFCTMSLFLLIFFLKSSLAHTNQTKSMFDRQFSDLHYIKIKLTLTAYKLLCWCRTLKCEVSLKSYTQGLFIYA